MKIYYFVFFFLIISVKTSMSKSLDECQSKQDAFIKDYIEFQINGGIFDNKCASDYSYIHHTPDYNHIDGIEAEDNIILDNDISYSFTTKENQGIIIVSVQFKKNKDIQYKDQFRVIKFSERSVSRGYQCYGISEYFKENYLLKKCLTK